MGTESGVPMEKVEDRDNVYSYTIKKGDMYNYENFKVMFLDGGLANQQTMNIRFEGFNKIFTVTGERKQDMPLVRGV